MVRTVETSVDTFSTTTLLVGQHSHPNPALCNTGMKNTEAKEYIVAHFIQVYMLPGSYLVSGDILRTDKFLHTNHM